MSQKFHPDYITELVAFQKASIEALRSVKLSSNAPDISHRVVVPHATYSPWFDEPMFLERYEHLKAHTLVDRYRCFELWSLAREPNIAGDIVEIGVWRGGTGLLMAAAASQRKVHLFDTFSGVVKGGTKDTIYKGGEHADTSEAQVRALASQMELENVAIYCGIFPDAVDLAPDTAVALCHIDVDTYASARDCFHSVWPKVSIGGCVVFDDYGFWGCEGVTRLVNELRDSGFARARILHNLNGHALIIKF
jgi:O-methyltransferase